MKEILNIYRNGADATVLCLILPFNDTWDCADSNGCKNEAVKQGYEIAI